MLISPIPPFLLQTPVNPDGVPQGLFDGFVEAAMADAPAWMKPSWITGSTRPIVVAGLGFVLAVESAS